MAHGKQLAVVLGGYLGTSAALLARKGYRVIAFEPVESFADAIEKKAAVEALPIQVVRTGAGNYDGIFRLSIDQDSTSMFGNASKPQAEFNVTHFSRWLRDLNQQVAVLEVNIEGGEYPVLEDLIESSEIQMVKRLLVQFHNFDSTHDMQRNAIRLSLEKTHSQDFNFPWVWECWSRRER